jgi:AcrR family transcriptional regulator
MELKDLAATLAALRRLAPRHLPRRGELARALTRASRAAAKKPTDRREMEAAISEFTTALALGKLDDALARAVRGYLRRHLDRARTLLARALPG